MTLKQAIKIVERHNIWRRGADIKMEHPRTLGEAIDILVAHAKKDAKGS